MREDLDLLFSVKGRSLLAGSEVESYWGPMSDQEEDYFSHTGCREWKGRGGVPHLATGDISVTIERISIKWRL